MSLCLSPPRVLISWKLESGVEPGPTPRYNMGCGCSNGSMTAVPKPENFRVIVSKRMKVFLIRS